MPRKRERSPAFQFYPKDYLSDINVISMNYAEQGMYVKLLCVCWLEGSIPADLGALARILQVSPEGLESAWRMIGKCFEVSVRDCSYLVHRRLQKERAKQAAWHAKCAEGGSNSRGKPKKLKAAMPEQGTVPLLNTVGTVNEQGRVSKGTHSYLLSSSPVFSLQSAEKEEGKKHVGKPTPADLLEIYNQENKKLPEVRAMTSDRKAKAATRLKNGGEQFVSDFRAAVRAAQDTPFLCGTNDRGWKAGFDWLIENDSNAVKVLEGKYSSGNGTKDNPFTKLLEAENERKGA